MFRQAPVLFLLLLFAAGPPAAAAGPHPEPGTLVADGSPDQAVLVLLYVQGGYGDAQSVYVVRPVARCRDPAGSGWYALPSARAICSVVVLEGGERLGTLDPAILSTGCADPVPSPLPPAAGTTWDRLLDGTLNPFGWVTFPSFEPPSVAQTTGNGSPLDDGGAGSSKSHSGGSQQGHDSPGRPYFITVSGRRQYERANTDRSSRPPR